MKIMNFFRKPYLAIFMASLFVLFSCEQNDEPTNIIDAQALKSIHQTISSDLNAALSDFNSSSISEQILSDSEAEQELISNHNYVIENGLESLLEKNGIDTEVLAEFEFYVQNKGNENVYDLLVEKFHFESLEEAKFLFNLVEINSLIESEFSDNSSRTEISWGCGLAIAGTVATTAGAAFITGGAALIVFLISKGIATAAIIDACS